MKSAPQSTFPGPEPSSVALWKHPNPHSTRIDAFRQLVNRKYELKLETYQQLHTWSVECLEDFCREIWDFCGFIHSVAPTCVAHGLESMWPRPEWFPGARINYSEALLLVGLTTNPNRVAVSACREGGAYMRHLTWLQLRNLVALYASALRTHGVKKGDRVAAIIENSVEALVLLLAAGSIGAIFSSTAPDMGVNGIVERYTQIRPKILFVTTEVLYAGRRRFLLKKMATAVSKLKNANPELIKVVVVTGSPWSEEICISLNQFLDVQVKPLVFEQLPFDYPIYILYSSGTTGLPKCICHSGGGALLQQKKEYILSSDMGPDSTYYQYTTTGWMMWNYLVGSLSVGSRIVLYDGSPLYPSPAHQVQFLEEQGVTHWGTSPKLLTSLKQTGFNLAPKLNALQVVTSAGSPLSPELHRWFYSVFPSRVALFSGSGGTDLVAGIVSGNCLVPIYEGELASAHLGMRVEVWNEDGHAVQDGQKGDLVITRPFFSMPVTFWAEDGQKKYHKAYFERFPGVWCHGDFIQRNSVTGGYVILGRSDGVLNPGGIRFGTAEIYGIVDTVPSVEDCIAVGQRRPEDDDEQVLLFMKLKNGVDFQQTRNKIHELIETQLSRRHVPAYTIQVNDIPYTMNGKKVETSVKAIVCKSDVRNTGMVANPQSLEEYRKYAELPLISKTSRL